jgi:hypothetical protein
MLRVVELFVASERQHVQRIVDGRRRPADSEQADLRTALLHNREQNVSSAVRCVHLGRGSVKLPFLIREKTAMSRAGVAVMGNSAVADSKPFRVHFLDMGTRKYGDCMLVECGGKSVLIDGGHAGDQKASSGGHRSIPEQLQKVLGHPPPFEIALLIVRFTSRKPLPLLEAFADIGLMILGPTAKQLKQCAQVVHDEERVARDAVDSFMQTHADAVGDDLIRAYRIAVQGLKTDMVDAEEKGASPAVNNQSLVFVLESQGQQVLFNGDMQFGAARTENLDVLMTQLRGVVAHEGPYGLAKLPHHGSYNGSDDAFFDEAAAPYWGMCAGEGDPAHPHSKILEILESRKDSLHWGRTDRNGLVTFSFSGEKWQMELEHGERDSLESNIASDTGAAPPPPGAEGVQALRPPGPPREPPAPPAVVPVQVERHDRDLVEVIARIPHVATEVTITINVRPREVVGPGPFDGGGGEGGAKAGPKAGPPVIVLGGGRNLPRLLFACSSAALSAKLRNPGIVNAILAVLRADRNKHIVVDIPPALPAADAAKLVTARLFGSGVAGVVLIGGYDVLSPFRVDVLRANRRAMISPKAMKADDDRFYVWSDALYGDLDGDRIAEFPVSRIPDGGSSALLVTALSATWRMGADWKGVRNVKRPFADYVLRKHAPTAALLRSEKTVASADLNVAAEQAYFMLHGATSDGTRFWGETIDAATGHTTGYPVAFNLACVPEHAPSVVFTGCCWGALTADPIARRASDSTHLVPRTTANSIALKYLQAGALAFVGCTGAHYSPTPPGTFYGGPMHDSIWNYLRSGDPPALSLFKAKRDYMARIPHGPDDPDSVAIEQKILEEFTCLGLGW